MSKLSELLNPAPQPGSSPPSTTHQPLPALETTGAQPEGDQSIRSTYVFTGNTQRRQSITSPLDALAAAATNSAPLPSPSRTSMTFVDAPPTSLPTSSSRPTSSHASPPRTFELPPVSQRPGQFSPGLEQYHQAHSDEVKARRLSSEMMEDPSRILPPLTQIQPEKEPLAALVNARSHNGGEDLDKESALEPSSQSPGFPIAPVAQAPVITQVRQPSPGPPQPISDAVLPKSQTEQVQVKTEMMDVPPQMTAMVAQGSPQPTGSASGSRRPSATPVSKSIAGLKKEASAQSSPAPPITKSPTPKTSEKPKAAPSKKRAAPKKGTASAVKPAAKKRKIEKTESTPATPTLPRNGTPNSSRASRTPVPKNRKQGSETPARSSSVLNANEDDDQDEGDSMSIDENEQFCICRGPDDHTWMIACDGGCDDWFHGRCVEMDEKDGKLIDKYICKCAVSPSQSLHSLFIPSENHELTMYLATGPNCIKAGRGQTLWKPMCRLPTCRKPARVDDSKPSKYCSDEHGTEFMRQLAFKGDPPSSPKKPPPTTTTVGGRRKSRKDNYTDNLGNAYEEDLCEEGDTFLRGGILRPAELKTLASSTNDVASFRALGEGVLSPPQTDEGDGDIKSSSPTATSHNPSTAIHFTPEEKVQLAEIKVKTNGLKERKRLLDDRETFLGMARLRAKSVVDEMKKKEKGAQICGFDARLAWADEEFEVWRASGEGKAIFDAGKLLGPVDKKAPKKQVNGLLSNDNNDDNDEEMPDSAKTPVEETAICMKKRCTRHRDWLRVQTNNLALDKDNVREEMRHLVAEDKGIKERAMIRSLEET